MVEPPPIHPGSDLAIAEDKRLVAEVLSKDRKATADFVSRYADCVYSYVRRRVMPRSEAVEDIVQEVFLAAWRSLERFRGEASLRHWILGIARHKVESYYRMRLRESEWPIGEDGLPYEPATLPLFEDELDLATRQEKTYRVLGGLPETYSTVLAWRYLENRSTREMAEMTGKSEKAVERLLARARQRFRESWNDEK